MIDGEAEVLRHADPRVLVRRMQPAGAQIDGRAGSPFEGDGPPAHAGARLQHDKGDGRVRFAQPLGGP